MSVALILFSLTALCLGTFGWLWLSAGLRHTGWRGVAGRLAVQVSGLCLLWGVLRGQPTYGLFMAMFPPVSVVPLVQLVPFGDFASRLMWAVAPVAGGVLTLCLVIPGLRIWALGLTVLAAMATGLVVGEGASQVAMCETAAQRGLGSFQRNGLMWSLANAPSEYQFGLHALATDGDRTLGWSYQAMDWYVVPENTVSNVAAGDIFICAP